MAAAEPTVKARFRKLFKKFSKTKTRKLLAVVILEAIWDRKPDPPIPSTPSISESRRAPSQRQCRSSQAFIDFGSHQSADHQVAHGAAAIWKEGAPPSMALCFKEGSSGLRAG